MGLDSRQVEIIGRNLLVSLFVADGIEVAYPARDRGIDLIAYYDIANDHKFHAVPVQMKSFSKSGFSIDKKYEKFPGMLMAYVWFAVEPLKSCLYVMTYREVRAIAESLGWTNTDSWINEGSYMTSNPSEQVLNAIEPYLYHSGKLANLVHDSL